MTYILNLFMNHNHRVIQEFSREREGERERGRERERERESLR